MPAYLNPDLNKLINIFYVNKDCKSFGGMWICTFCVKIVLSKTTSLFTMFSLFLLWTYSQSLIYIYYFQCVREYIINRTKAHDLFLYIQVDTKYILLINAGVNLHNLKYINRHHTYTYVCISYMHTYIKNIHKCL